MITKEQITDWFCERNQIKKEELDKYHRYAIATTFKYAQAQVKNLDISPIMRFKFISGNDTLLNIKANKCYPRTGNFIWIDKLRYQITSVHIDYSNNEMRFYCA